MIFEDNRVPGQLMPVGARWWCNGGKPLHNPLKSVAGLSGIDGDLRASAIKGLGVTSELEAGPATTLETRKAMAAFTGVTLGVLITALAVRGGLGYVAGRAMAPSAKDKNAYGWWGVLSGGVFGVTGLAVQGAVSLSRK